MRRCRSSTCQSSYMNPRDGLVGLEEPLTDAYFGPHNMSYSPYHKKVRPYQGWTSDAIKGLYCGSYLSRMGSMSLWLTRKTDQSSYGIMRSVAWMLS